APQAPRAEAPNLASWTSARASASMTRPAPTPALAPAPASRSPTLKAVASAPAPRATPPSAAAPAPAAPAPTASPPMDRDFIARNQIVERYLSGRLPPGRSAPSATPAITIGGANAQLADFKIDESRSPYHSFRVTIDRIDQGRVAVITNLTKDSNGHLRMALNTSAFGPGNYQLTIEGIGWRGDPEPDSWITIGITR